MAGEKEKRGGQGGSTANKIQRAKNLEQLSRVAGVTFDPSMEQYGTIEELREIAQAIVDVKRDFPDLVTLKTVKAVNSSRLRSSTIADEWGTEITFYSSRKEDAVDLGMRHVATHELGHHLVERIVAKNGGDWSQTRDSQSWERRIVTQAKKNAERIDGRKHYITEVSAYGGTNNGEAIAEAVMQHYTRPADRIRILPQQIWLEVKRRAER